ncbi:hypothetical protein ERO13_A11G130800v2 [Gossypium hirsutum]|uniref:Actin-depolymerizing factor isoform X1 n=1 Tax=Gossypium hirsutum TaxID=3635 RepID=A0ABM2Z2Z1_GOSHI|nr:actin-depolymerizing factor-like isoform X1 [Gossypium hirsutum]KAG4174588.1 hypothetical protein ERO13_A11G130800v2 [Gossypium hirsutum]
MCHFHFVKYFTISNSLPCLALHFSHSSVSFFFNLNFTKLPCRLQDWPNATSGMCAAGHAKDTFLEQKRKKIYRYLVFRIDEKKRKVVVEKTGDPAETYDDFTASLPENDCRYAVYDFDFVTSDNCQKSKIFFIAWSPSSSRIRSKVLYATSKHGLREELDGIHYEIQATDPTEMDLEVLKDRAN